MGKITAQMIREMKGRGQKIASLTAYDFPMTRLLDEAGIPLILVGDSLGMVVLGYPDTTHVTMAEMEHHIRAVARAKPGALIGGDLPYHSYETIFSADQSARRLVAAGATVPAAHPPLVNRWAGPWQTVPLHGNRFDVGSHLYAAL